MTTYDIYNPPIISELLICMKELSDKEAWGFYLYIIDNPNVTYKEMSEDLGIPIPELVRIHKKCYSCRQYVKYPFDIGDYEKSYLEVYPFMKRLVIDVLNSFYEPFGNTIDWFKEHNIRMLPYYNDDVGELP
jgi:hypothetical protein